MTLALHQLRFSYNDRQFALSVPELVIQPGECIALVGPSGSGKTTLLNLIAGILQPESGRILLNDASIMDLTQSRRREYRLRQIGMIFQSFELLDYLDVRDNILLQARLCNGVTIDKKLEQRGLAIAENLGIGDKWRRSIQVLSQGERQRVAVCRALLLEPSLVLADEPTGNLDPDNKQAVLNNLLQQCREKQQILLTVTHDHSLLPSFDRVIDMATLLAPIADKAVTE